MMALPIFAGQGIHRFWTTCIILLTLTRLDYIGQLLPTIGLGWRQKWSHHLLKNPPCTHSIEYMITRHYYKGTFSCCDVGAISVLWFFTFCLKTKICNYFFDICICIGKVQIYGFSRKPWQIFFHFIKSKNHMTKNLTNNAARKAPKH